SDLRTQHVPDNGTPDYTSRPGLQPSLFRRAHNSRSCHWRIVANRSLFSSDWLASTKPELSLFCLSADRPANSSDYAVNQAGREQRRAVHVRAQIGPGHLRLLCLHYHPDRISAATSCAFDG